MPNYSIKKQDSIESNYVNEIYNLKITYGMSQGNINESAVNVDLFERDTQKVIKQLVSDLARTDSQLQAARLILKDLLPICVKANCLPQKAADSILSSLYDKVVEEKQKSK